jgi:hypothetical protein
MIGLPDLSDQKATREISEIKATKVILVTSDQ